MIQLTFPLPGLGSVGALRSVYKAVNTYHVAGPGLIKTNHYPQLITGARADLIFKTVLWCRYHRDPPLTGGVHRWQGQELPKIKR